MIARIWKGVVQLDDADVYGDRTEFLTLSLWDSVDAIRAFAGDDIEAAVLYPGDERYLVGGQSTVMHYQVVDQVEAPSGSGEGA
jgi:heme-degrading monooxygenase HmoA